MKKLTVLIAAAAFLGTTALAPAVYVPMTSGLSGGTSIVLVQMKDEKDKGKKDKAKPKPKAKKSKDKDKDKDKDKGKT